MTVHLRLRQRGWEGRHGRGAADRDTGPWRPQLPGPRRQRRPGHRPAAGHRPGHRAGRRARGADHPHRRDAHPQRLPHRRARPRRRHRRGVPGQRRRPGRLRPDAGLRRRHGRGRRRAAAAGAGHPGPHLHPPELRAGIRWPGGRGVHRRFAALRHHRAARPARARAHRRARPGAVRLRPSPRPAARRHPGLPDARFRQLLLGRAVRSASPPRSPPRCWRTRC